MSGADSPIETSPSPHAPSNGFGSLSLSLAKANLHGAVRIAFLHTLQYNSRGWGWTPTSTLDSGTQTAMDASTVLFNQLKAAEPFFLLAGPNVIESEEHILKMAKHIKGITSSLGLPLVFKSSFDKANRTSSKSFRGPGLDEGLKVWFFIFIELL
ncbi:hypothetical protein Taro_018430 [Colocasia esculenta]|uniref:3-deoxy-8-phosphooctulonate synthase n=1 Tax=Colocasia esculenta TaxID=4460 RepID=A0A843UW57_COLES|nr:hypothetical protein [Colocasia esculenta]